MLKRKYDKCKNTINWAKYRIQRNLVTKIRKNSMTKFSKINATHQEKVKNCKPLISNKSINKNDNVIILSNNNVVTKQEEVATVFNNYLTNMAKKSN